jgi:GTP-binding protein
LLLHLLDITYKPEKDILEDYTTIRNEMEEYNPALCQKPQIVLINKMDLYGPKHRDLEMLHKALDSRGVECLPISALTGEGINNLEEIIYEHWVKNL